MKKKKSIMIIIISVCAAAMLLFSVYLLMDSRSFQLSGKIVNHIDTDKKIIALTFDDGPTEKTGEILKILSGLDIKCTFFFTGKQIEQDMEDARAIVSDGHQIGNHSYSHVRMIFKSEKFISDELDRTNSLIREAGFAGDIVFRPPYTKKLVLLPLELKERSMTTVTFDVEPETYLKTTSSSDDIAKYVIDHARNGSIILLHIMYDSGKNSLEALPLIVKGLRDKGYEFATVNELLAETP